MEDRITLNVFYVGLISAVIAVLFTSMAFRSSLIVQAENAQASAAQLIAAAYDESDDPEDLERYALRLEGRIRLYQADGALLYDSQADGDTTGSAEVLAWPEVADALETGAGSARRKDTETGAVELYCAVQLEDGSILQLSEDSPQLPSAMSRSFGYILVIILVILVFASLFSYLLARRVLKPIRALPALLEQPNFDPEKIDVYPELVPLLQEITERRNERESMRQEFTANVSHELKTPLTTISGYSEMIATGMAAPEDIPRFAEKIHAEAERMQDLVGDIIELNALDSETIHDHTDRVDLLALVQDCVERLSPHFEAERLSVYITGDGFTVQGDQRQLWELVYNLLDNARRYNVPGGMIRVSVEGRTLSVRDTGIGIAKEHQGRVFERFYRVDKSHSRATGGTGLGLSIVKHVAELHGATLELESQEHIGTEIRVTFPGSAET